VSACILGNQIKGKVAELAKVSSLCQC